MFDGFTDDEEDAFFAPISSSSSNLASLFGVPMNSSASAPTVANTDLTYTAPKQPSNTKMKDTSKTSHKQKGNSVVIKFKEVQAFKIISGNQTAQGKCGLALIGNETLCIYQLLLYKQKSDIICTAKVNNKFQFTALRDNYASYSDTEKQHWTVLFTGTDDLTEFTGAIESRGGMIVNNLPVDKQDIPKQEVSTETFEPVIDSVVDKSGVNAKADILSRMAKMGQRLLPDTTKSSDDASSENENDKLILKSRKPRKSVSATGSSTGMLIKRTEVTSDILPNTPSTQQQYVMINGKMCPLLQSPTFVPDIASISQVMLPTDTYNAQHITPDKMNMYFVENRTHNCEVRMNIMRLTTKLEEVMDKVNKIDLNNSSVTEEHSHRETIQKNMKLDIENLEKRNVELTAMHKNDSLQNAEMAQRIKNLLGEMEQQKRLMENHSKKDRSYMEQIKNLEIKIKEQLLQIESYETNPNYVTVDVKKIGLLDENVKKIMNSLYQEVSLELKDHVTLGQDAIKILAQKIRDSTYYIIAAVKELEVADIKRTP